MSSPHDHAREHRDRRRGLAAVGVALVAVAIGLSAGVTSSSDSAVAEGAAAWVQRERPAGAVLTVDGWDDAVADGDRLRVVTAAEDEIAALALTADPGSVVVPVDAAVVDDLRTDDAWSVAYRDTAAIVFIHDGALPVPGAT